ncbi:hypothetical protein C0558_08225 [Serratia marcescens]|nr:hypothetical protein C0558_08225 [Serratia marcescens]
MFREGSRFDKLSDVFMMREYRILNKIMRVFSKKTALPVSFEYQRDYAENFKNAVRLTSLLGFNYK